MSAVVIIGALTVLIVIGVMVWLLVRSQRPDLTGKPDGEKPDWMRSLPPKETIAALQEDGKKMAVFDHDAGENLAAPFAEQIEDMVRARLNADPFLKSTKIDFGTAPDGGIEFVINNQRFSGLEQLPDGRIKSIIREAIEAYNQHK